MPLTKSEFDRWKAQADEASVQMADTPAIHELALIYRDGFLRIMQGPSGLGPVETRALYEMLRAWYGEATMTETAKAVIDSTIAYIDASGYMCVPKYEQMKMALDAYRAEQKQ